MFIKQGKNDPFRTGAGIYLSRTGSHLCLATVVLNYLPVHSGDEGPLFVFNDGHYLSRQCLVFHLQTTLRSCGPVALTYVYISDSFHIRATTLAASIGSEDSIIHMLGQ